MSILSNDKESKIPYPELKSTESILTNSQKSVVINNKLRVSDFTLKNNKMEYLILKAKMIGESEEFSAKYLELLPAKLLEKILLDKDINYGQIEALKQSEILKNNIDQIDQRILTVKLLQKMVIVL